MPKTPYLVEVTHYHNSDLPDYKTMLDLDPGDDPELWAALSVIDDLSGASCDCYTPSAQETVAAALQKAKETGEPQQIALPEVDDDEETFEFTIVHKPGAFVVGEDDGSDRYKNRWLEVAPFKPDPCMQERLEKLSKEQLLEILLRTHAVTQLSIPVDLVY